MRVAILLFALSLVLAHVGNYLNTKEIQSLKEQIGELTE